MTRREDFALLSGAVIMEELPRPEYPRPDLRRDVEQEVNGPLTCERRPKFSSQRIAASVGRCAAIEEPRT